jgi:hypothetical protein
MNAINTGNEGPIVVTKVLDVTILTKCAVTNDHGESLGKIDTIMIDLETGKIAYAILSFGGFPNRTKLLAVPWELLVFSHHDKKLILNVPRDLVVKSPGYDTFEQIVQAPDFYWLGEVYEYYSHKTEWDQKREEERKNEVLRSLQKRSEINNVNRPAEAPKA